MSDSSSRPDAPAEPGPSLPRSTTVGQRVDALIAGGQRFANKASPHIRNAIASGNAALDKVSAKKPWIKPTILGGAGVVLLLMIWHIASAVVGGRDSTGGAGRNGSAAFANFDRVAPGMTLDEVRALLGNPDSRHEQRDTLTSGGHVTGYDMKTNYLWESETETIMVTFQEGRVAYKDREGKTPTTGP